MKLYFGNLPFDTTEGDLRVILELTGEEFNHVKIITDRETGRSKGFGFVETSCNESGQKIIDKLHKRPITSKHNNSTREIVVAEARDRK